MRSRSWKVHTEQEKYPKAIKEENRVTARSNKSLYPCFALPFLSIYVEYLGHNIYRRFLRRK